MGRGGYSVASMPAAAAPPLDTTHEDDPDHDEDHGEQKQPDDYKKGPVGSLRGRSAGPSSPPPPVSSTAGCPSLIYNASELYVEGRIPTAPPYAT